MARRGGTTGFFLAVFIVLIGYFSYHAVKGRHGLEARSSLEVRVRALEAELTRLKTEREQLERKAAAMTLGPSGDPDLIEEQARAILNFARPGDVVYVQPR
jgi:cell division protein FtsB